MKPPSTAEESSRRTAGGPTASLQYGQVRSLSVINARQCEHMRRESISTIIRCLADATRIRYASPHEMPHAPVDSWRPVWTIARSDGHGQSAHAAPVGSRTAERNRPRALRQADEGGFGGGVERRDRRRIPAMLHQRAGAAEYRT